MRNCSTYDNNIWSGIISECKYSYIREKSMSTISLNCVGSWSIRFVSMFSLFPKIFYIGSAYIQSQKVRICIVRPSLMYIHSLSPTSRYTLLLVWLLHGRRHYSRWFDCINPALSRAVKFASVTYLSCFYITLFAKKGERVSTCPAEERDGRIEYYANNRRIRRIE